MSLDDDRVLIAGGTGVDGPVSSVEIYGLENAPPRMRTPLGTSQGSVALTLRNQAAPDMLSARSGHTCTLLSDGSVLAAGGAAEPGAEVWDPNTVKWVRVEGQTLPRSGHTATLLPGGQVLLAGGSAGGKLVAGLEIFDPSTNTLAAANAALSEPRTGHVAIPLSDGRVLFAGGTNGERSLASAEIFDPASGAVKSAASMTLARAGHGAAVLVDGRILVMAGTDGNADLGNAELYIESEDRWEGVAASMVTPRRNPFVTLIPGSGLVLIAGGEHDGKPTGDTEVFEPWNNLFRSTGPLTLARTRFSGAILVDGTVFAAGGQTAGGPSKACGTFTTPSMKFTSSEYAPSAIAVVAGSGWGKPGSIIQGVSFSLRLSTGASQAGRLLATVRGPG